MHLYEEYGLNFVERLCGMFGFAIWDRNRERLVLARDRVGNQIGLTPNSIPIKGQNSMQ